MQYSQDKHDRYVAFIRNAPDKRMMAQYLHIEYQTLMGKLNGYSRFTEEQSKLMDAVMEEQNDIR